MERAVTIVDCAQNKWAKPNLSHLNFFWLGRQSLDYLRGWPMYPLMHLPLSSEIPDREHQLPSCFSGSGAPIIAWNSQHLHLLPCWISWSCCTCFLTSLDPIPQLIPWCISWSCCTPVYLYIYLNPSAPNSSMYLMILLHLFNHIT
jgi:hypothetical protein